MKKNLTLIALARIVLLVLGQFFVFLNYYFFSIEISMLWAQVFLAMLACSAALDLFWVPSHFPAETRIRFQLISDVIILTLLFHATGGAANPFVSILLFPLVISTAILKGRFNWFMVCFTLFCYGTLFMVLPWSQTANMHHDHQHSAAIHDNALFSLHIIGMWFNFAISAVLISVFVVRMRQVIDQQQLALQEQKEQALRDEQLLGIATQAASAAHHLGTPLSTMSVILHDLELENLPEAWKEELSLLRSQVDICKQVLSQLKGVSNSTPDVQRVDVFINTLIDEFRLLQPGVQLQYDAEGCHIDSYMLTDASLRMAVLNILQNAADASPERILFQAQTDRDSLIISITDFGSGFVGNPYFLPLESIKDNGLGIGLFITHATLKRYGGTIQLLDHKYGARVEVSIPLFNEKKSSS